MGERNRETRERGFTIDVLIEITANGAFPQEKPNIAGVRWGNVIVKHVKEVR
jgi:hypothetical protein